MKYSITAKKCPSAVKLCYSTFKKLCLDRFALKGRNNSYQNRLIIKQCLPEQSYHENSKETGCTENRRCNQTSQIDFSKTKEMLSFDFTGSQQKYNWQMYFCQRIILKQTKIWMCFCQYGGCVFVNLIFSGCVYVPCLLFNK